MKEHNEQQGPRAGDTVTAEIESVAFGGAGVARQDGLVLFIPFTAPGDTVRAVVEVRKRNLAECRLEEVITPGPGRTQPPCPHFGTCGGCQYQHLAYPAQLAMKERQLRDVFARIAGMPDPPLEPIVPSPAEFGYRIKADFNIKRNRVGFVATDNRTIVDIDRCMIMADMVNRQYASIRERLARQEIRIKSHYITLWESSYDVPLTGEETPSVIHRTVLDKTFSVPYFSFFQANGALTGALVRKVVDLCAPEPDHTVADCYCGCGLFTVFLADRAGTVVGIESTRSSINAARAYVEQHGIENVDFRRGTVEKHLPRLIQRDGMAIETAVIDPPRCGCARSVLDTLVDAGPARIVYVSCNPSTQARDAAYLKERGYRLDVLQPFDMFPQTKHMESVARFVRA